jgi:methylmalonyl-CoA/ethylmalonyl-CoA epimerase
MIQLASFPIDHIGIAVENLDAAISHHKNLYGTVLVERETLIDRGIELAFLATSNTRLEFIAPITLDDDQNTIVKFLKKRGSGLHHICYEVPRIEIELERLEKSGATLIDKTPRKGACSSRIAFIMPSKVDGLLIELCDYPSKFK